MKRQWNFDLEQPDQEGQNYALALGAIAGPEFIRSVLDAYAMMSRVGGELYIGTYREKFAERETGEYDEFGDPVTQVVAVGPDEVGTWHTLGFTVHYESVAKLTGKVTEAVKEPDDRLTRARPLKPQPAPEDNSNEPAPEAIENADREALEAIESAA